MEGDIHNMALHGLSDDRDVDYTPRTLTPVWPMAKELRLADMRGDKLNGEQD